MHQRVHLSTLMILLVAARALSRPSGQRVAADRAAMSVITHMQHEAMQNVDELVKFYRKVESSWNLTPRIVATTSAEEEFRRFVDENIDSVLFDCDGVLYRSPDPAPGAAACLESLVKRGKRLLFVTNNADSNRKQLREKLHSILGVDFLTEDMMVSASYSVAQYLKHNVLDTPRVADSAFHGGRIHVIGSEGLCQELRDTGFSVTGGPDEVKPSMSRDELADYDFDEHPIDALVIGHDTEFTFRKMSIANVLLQLNPQALFTSTNEDAFDLVGADSRHIPGNGCIVRALEHSSGRRATCTGKPHKVLADLILREHGIDPSRTLMVGDRLDTDIKWAVNSGMYSLLVMTGVTTPGKLRELRKGTSEEPLPDFIAPTVSALC